jgi:hypothetical protein
MSRPGEAAPAPPGPRVPLATLLRGGDDGDDGGHGGAAPRHRRPGPAAAGGALPIAVGTLLRTAPFRPPADDDGGSGGGPAIADAESSWR